MRGVVSPGLLVCEVGVGVNLSVLKTGVKSSMMEVDLLSALEHSPYACSSSELFSSSGSGSESEDVLFFFFYLISSSVSISASASRSASTSERLSARMFSSSSWYSGKGMAS